MSESQDIQTGGLAPAAPSAPSSNITESINNSVPSGSAIENQVGADEAAPALFEETQEALTDRPDWLPEKFKTGEDLSKSYQELEKKLGAHSGAPENYEIEISEDLQDYAIDAEAPLAQGFFKVMQENGINQKTANELAALHATQSRADDEAIAAAEEQAFNEDCKELGPDRLQEIKDSIKKMGGLLSEDSFELLKTIGNKSVEVGKMVDEIIKAYDSKNYAKIPDGAANMEGKSDLHEQIKERIGDPRHGRDKDYTRKTRDMYATLLR